jgi:hypothetical protein
MAATVLSTFLQHVRRSMLRHDNAGQTDGTLLECFITQHDEAAFEALVPRHGPMVLGVCRRALRNEADAEALSKNHWVRAVVPPGNRVTLRRGRRRAQDSGSCPAQQLRCRWTACTKTFGPGRWVVSLGRLR